VRPVAITALVLALFAGTAAAFVLTVSLKLVRSPLDRVRVEPAVAPTCACRHDEARIRFRVRRPDRIDVVVLDEAGEAVRTLLEDERRSRGRTRVAWDGRDDAGNVVSDGRYQVRVHFRSEERTIDIPTPIEVDTTPPRVRVLAVRPPVFSPDGDGRRDEFAIDYVADEAAAPIVLVDAVVVFEGPLRDAGETRVVWDGTSNGRPLPPGTYGIAVQGRDRLGNAGELADGDVVRIRYIDLTRNRLVVRRGGVLRFRVDTDAAAFAWQLRRAAGRERVVLRKSGVRRRSVAVRLPLRIRRGLYLLRVQANGYEDVAVVRVRRRA
jgi:FlgD Ig-like domain